MTAARPLHQLLPEHPQAQGACQIPAAEHPNDKTTHVAYRPGAQVPTPGAVPYAEGNPRAHPTAVTDGFGPSHGKLLQSKPKAINRRDKTDETDRNSQPSAHSNPHLIVVGC